VLAGPGGDVGADVAKWARNDGYLRTARQPVRRPLEFSGVGGQRCTSILIAISGLVAFNDGSEIVLFNHAISLIAHAVQTISPAAD
jgi:hypothetical protein